RRHTRFDCDWSSDVCSSDLGQRIEAEKLAGMRRALVTPACAHDADRLVTPRASPIVRRAERLDLLAHPADPGAEDHTTRRQVIRSEERRVGKACRPRTR